jgi:hypothetical protein
MTRFGSVISMVALLAATAASPAGAAEATPPSDPSKPVTTARVGGSPADRDFRAAQQEIAQRYRETRAACKARPSGERSACVSAARVDMKKAQLEAKTAHDAASRKKPR